MDLPRGREDRKKFWLDHVKAAAQFSGSDIEYCKINGLHQRTFSAKKTEYGFTKKSRKASQGSFVPITLKKSKVNSLPDSKWLAQLILELQKGL